jgi:hypothetical protein
MFFAQFERVDLFTIPFHRVLRFVEWSRDMPSMGSKESVLLFTVPKDQGRDEERS